MTDKPNKINIRRTQRGFYRGDFLDIYDNKCSIQDSSLAGRDALWLGQNTGTHHLGACVARMHIDTELARELIILIERFVATGSIKETEVCNV